MSQDHDYLDQQLDANVETYAERFAAVDGGTDYDDGCGCPQDPSTVLSQAVMEVGAPAGAAPAAEHRWTAGDGRATIERGGTLSGHRITASMPWNDVARHVHPGSPVGPELDLSGGNCLTGQAISACHRGLGVGLGHKNLGGITSMRPFLRKVKTASGDGGSGRGEEARPAQDS